jgi:hypothetical protein
VTDGVVLAVFVRDGIVLVVLADDELRDIGEYSDAVAMVWDNGDENCIAGGAT